jgi:serine/threonine-protein kinase
MTALSPGTRIGEYEIVAPLRAGGMASLYLARRAGAAGFSKPVAIKVIHTHLARDPAFVEMFLDEARLSARIQDPNVVHVEDLGEADGMFYLAMEYVLGVSLASLLARHVQGDQQLDPALAVAIAMRVADGLHAAHELRDEHGASLEVVHRDVSPQNVLVSEAGHVKLIDFGVARARGRLQETEAGALKGKVRYMSPEQAYGRPIDRRTDVYALGIVLWEMLTMRRLIEGANDIEALELARAPRVVPPTRHRPGLPPDLDHVVVTALARDADARYATAQAFRRALAGAMPAALRVEPSDLAALLESLFARQLAKERLLMTSPELAPAEERVSSSPGRSSAVGDPGPTRAPSSRSRRAPEDPALSGSASGDDAPTEASTPPVVAAPVSAGGPDPRESTAGASAPASSARWALLGGVLVGGVGLAAAAAVAVAWSYSSRVEPAGIPAPPPTPMVPLEPVAPAFDPCAAPLLLQASFDEVVRVVFDTRQNGSAFELRGLRNPESAHAPDQAIEIVVPGTDRTTLTVSTETEETDPEIDTVLAVFEGSCREALVTARPIFSADDQARERRARGSFAARGGSTVTVVVSGFGGDVLGMLDRGRIGFEVGAHATTGPELARARAAVANELVVFEVEGSDADLDTDRARVRLFDATGEPIALHARGHRMGLLEQTILLPLQERAEIRGAGRLLVRSGDAAVLSRARTAEIVLRDRAGNSTAPRLLTLERAEEVGPGARCDATHVCAPELECGGTGRCAASAERTFACGSAPELALVPGEEVRVTASLPAGGALFEASCAEQRARGREDLRTVTLPRGRWDLLLATRPAEERSAPPDMVLSVRRECLDERDESSPEAACNDDRAEGEPRPRLELRDLAGGGRYVVLASAVREGPDVVTDGLAYVLTARLRPVLARGASCDPDGERDRCADGGCLDGRCAPPR